MTDGLRLPTKLQSGDISISTYEAEDAQGLFNALNDQRVWEHFPGAVPLDADDLDALIRREILGLTRTAFSIRQSSRFVGTTSLLVDRRDAEGVEIGATYLDPTTWGTGVNSIVKRLLIDALFDLGVEWIRFRTDERNLRSAAAILKLGAIEEAARRDALVRRDGSIRVSRFFRLSRPTDRPRN